MSELDTAVVSTDSCTARRQNRERRLPTVGEINLAQQQPRFRHHREDCSQVRRRSGGRCGRKRNVCRDSCRPGRCGRGEQWFAEGKRAICTSGSEVNVHARARTAVKRPAPSTPGKSRFGSALSATRTVRTRRVLARRTLGDAAVARRARCRGFPSLSKSNSPQPQPVIGRSIGTPSPHKPTRSAGKSRCRHS